MLSELPPKDIKTLSDQVVSDPHSLLFASLADFYYESGLLDEAIRMCLAGLELHPQHVEGHFVLGKAYLAKGEFVKAKNEFSMVLRLNPNHKTAQKYLQDLETKIPATPLPIVVSKDEAPPAPKVPEKSGQAGVSPIVLPEISKLIEEKLPAVEMVEVKEEEKPVSPEITKGIEKLIGKTPTVGVGPIFEKKPEEIIPPKVSIVEEGEKRQRELENALKELVAIPGVMAVLVVEKGGFVVAEMLNEKVITEATGAFSASIYNTAKDSLQRINLGEFERGVIETSEERIFLAKAGEGVLVVLAKEIAKQGLIIVTTKRTVERIAKWLI
ncbi:MAG: roadblock/LC7 domain-containing protein [Candidatus Edwardsbacteria bacterium]